MKGQYLLVCYDAQGDAIRGVEPLAVPTEAEALTAGEVYLDGCGYLGVKGSCVVYRLHWEARTRESEVPNGQGFDRSQN